MDRGVPKKRCHVTEAANFVIENLHVERKSVLPFANEHPSKKWVRNLYGRHKHILKFGQPLIKEGSDLLQQALKLQLITATKIG